MLSEIYRPKSYYKLYELKTEYISKDDFESLAHKDKNHLYVVGTYIDNEVSKIDLYIGGNKLNAEASDIYFETINNTEKTIKDVIDELKSALAMNTVEYIGKNIELHNVYPIQELNTSLQVISKNIVEYSQDFAEVYSSNDSISGIEITVGNKVFNSENTINYIYDDSEPYFKVSGTSTDNIDYTVDLASANFTTPGRYSISLHDYVTNNSCYIAYELEDSDGNIISTGNLLNAHSGIIDTNALNCKKIKFKLCIKLDSGQTLTEQLFKLQVEFGENVTPYTHPRRTGDCHYTTVDIYGVNLIHPDEIYTNGIRTPLFDNGVRTSALTEIPISASINGKSLISDLSTGVKYFTAEILENNNIEIILDENNAAIIKTPLLENDNFIFRFNVTSISNDIATISDIQIMSSSNINYREYESYEIDSTQADSNGFCDISHLNYPYSFITINRYSQTSYEGLVVHIKNPKLSKI